MQHPSARRRDGSLPGFCIWTLAILFAHAHSLRLWCLCPTGGSRSFLCLEVAFRRTFRRNPCTRRGRVFWSCCQISLLFWIPLSALLLWANRGWPRGRHSCWWTADCPAKRRRTFPCCWRCISARLRQLFSPSPASRRGSRSPSGCETPPGFSSFWGWSAAFCCTPSALHHGICRLCGSGLLLHPGTFPGDTVGLCRTDSPLAFPQSRCLLRPFSSGLLAAVVGRSGFFISSALSGSHLLRWSLCR